MCNQEYYCIFWSYRLVVCQLYCGLKVKTYEKKISSYSAFCILSVKDCFKLIRKGFRVQSAQFHKFKVLPLGDSRLCLNQLLHCACSRCYGICYRLHTHTTI